MEMMMPSQNMYHQGYMQHQQYTTQQQQHQQQQQQQQHQQQHLGYYDNQKMQDQCMMYSNTNVTMDTGYSQNDLPMVMMNKRYRTDSVQLLRCRRRMDLARLQQTFKTHPTAVARRNERERNRVKHINGTFANLRQHLPTSAKTKKMSKVDTLHCAIRYIKHLQTILQDPQGDDVTTTQTHCSSPLSPESYKSPPATPSTCRTDSPVCESLQDGSSPEQDLLSPAGRDALSPCTETTSQGSPSCQRSASPYASDDAGYETLETGADDLADLVGWFQ